MLIFAMAKAYYRMDFDEVDYTEAMAGTPILNMITVGRD